MISSLIPSISRCANALANVLGDGKQEPNNSFQSFFYCLPKRIEASHATHNHHYRLAKNLVGPDPGLVSVGGGILLDFIQQEVAQLFRKYGQISVPVVDDNNVLKGVITVDDMLGITIYLSIGSLLLS